MAIEVLLIDDDPVLSVMLRMLLRGQDFQIQAFLTGEEGIRACQTSPPDVVILDLLMPGMDGWEVCKKVREASDAAPPLRPALAAPACCRSSSLPLPPESLIKPVHAS